MDFTAWPITTQIYFFANILYCSAYIVRDMMWLRVLTIIAAACTYPYFYFQAEILYSALFWQTAFLVINLINLIHLMYQRRKIKMTDQQQWLHENIFSALAPHEMLKLLGIAKWAVAETGQQLINKGQRCEKLLLVYRGRLKVAADGKAFAELQDGQFAGEMSFMTGKETSADIVSKEETTYLFWDKQSLDTFFAKHPYIRSVVNEILASDMASKLVITRAAAQPA